MFANLAASLNVTEAVMQSGVSQRTRAIRRLEKLARGMLRSFRVKYDFWSYAPEFNELLKEPRSLSPAFWRW
ncbi:hypothetical protein [Bradyrhizobium liaoningense]